MVFSKACEYGIRATVYIARQSLNQNRASLKDISKEIDSPVAFTAKILQELVRHGIINSVKGATGGFEADLKKMRKTKLMDIIVAIDGGLDDNMCILGLKKCSAVHPCPVHHKYKSIRKDFQKMLNTTSLSEMSYSLKDGLSWLKI